ncbi:hypothetical protein BaRGS_00037018 [Batillaria attramentaria]|uniref:CUE domain-containing protein n=1 Tax=Batillaria attramentaria TaxID=370345 RepID=A0ABD0JA14_9CAEN
MATGVPLDKKEINDGSAGTFPALHPHWVSKSRFVVYLPPPENASDQGQLGEWLERLQYLATDLHWLLQLSHHKFWCQAVFDETLHQMLESFLRFAPRSHDMYCELPSDARNLHDQVTRLVFLTYVRMATYKESKDNLLTPEVFGEIIYENFLFDIPKILDLCALYGRNNTALLSKMVGNIFTHQPHYLDDLRDAVPTILQVLSNICIKCGLETDASGLTPQKLAEGGCSVEADLVTMELSEFQDVLFYLADTAVTLTGLAHAYEKVIPAFQSSMKQRQFDSVRQKKLLRNKLQQGRTHLLMAFHLVVDNTCLQPVLNDPRFLADYEGQFSFQDDMDIFCQSSGDVDSDEAHYKYIQDAINSAFAAHGKRKKPKGNTNTGGRTSPDGSPCPPTAQQGTANGVRQQTTGPAGGCSAVVSTHTEPEGASARTVSGVELDSLICAVQDLLPHLGTGFIQRALEEFDFNPEKVVSAVLEDKLPQTLQGLDFSEERHNIYDNDEFDIFRSGSVDLNRIHKGKRDQEASLDDKGTIRQLKSLYEAYGSMDVPSMYDSQMYDDEYDDTYDTNNTFHCAQVLRQRAPKSEESEDSSEEEEQQRDSFVQDPAKRRAQQEQKRAARQQNAAQKYDVKGRGRGQGQSEDVLRNRRFKEKNKGARANHNRRTMADKKMNKGMY